MMRRSSLILVLSCFVLLGGTCPVPSIGIPCSNDLDASEFGFILSVPPDFSCAEILPDSDLLVGVGYRNETADINASIIVAAPSSPDENSNYTVEELDPMTNAHGVTAQRLRVVATQDNVNFYIYVGSVDLPSGNELSVSLGISNNDAGLLEALDAILATVQLVSG